MISIYLYYLLLDLGLVTSWHLLQMVVSYTTIHFTYYLEVKAWSDFESWAILCTGRERITAAVCYDTRYEGFRDLTCLFNYTLLLQL